MFWSRGEAEGKSGSQVPSPSLWDRRQNSHSLVPHLSFLARTKPLFLVYYKKLLPFFLTRDQVLAAQQPTLKHQQTDKTKLFSLIFPSTWVSPFFPPQILDKEFSPSQIFSITTPAQTLKGPQSYRHGNASLPRHYSSSRNFIVNPKMMPKDPVSGSVSSEERIPCQ